MSTARSRRKLPRVRPCGNRQRVPVVSNRHRRCLGLGAASCLPGKSRPLTRRESTKCERRYDRTQQYSITALTDGAGQVVERYAYTAYGEPTILDASLTVLPDSAVDNRYLYTGREWDGELGLYHYRARMYSANSGRFISRDPIGFWDGSNLYRIGIGLTKTDSTGTCVEPRTPKECCDQAFANPEIAIPEGKTEPSAGMVICCDGQKIGCGRLPHEPGIPREWEREVVDCIGKHEEDHFDDIGPCPDFDPENPSLTRPSFLPELDDNYEECKAYDVQLSCLMGKPSKCNGNERCLHRLQQAAWSVVSKMRSRRCKSSYGISPPDDWREAF